MSKRERRAIAALIREDFLEALQQIFKGLEEQNPRFANTFKADFDEYMRVTVEIYNSDPDGNTTIEDVVSRIPNNLWIELLKEMFAGVPEIHEWSEEEMQEFRAKVKARAKGKDIH